MNIFALCLVGVTLLISGCAPTIEEYKNETPQLRLNEYFNGTVHACGLIEDFNTKVVKRFSITMLGAWQGNKGTLKEHFIFSDGTTRDRIWYITLLDDHNLTATAPDVVGTATGRIEGNALQMFYDIQLPSDGSTHVLSADDRIFLLDKNHAMNRARLNKLGVTVAEMSIYFEKDNGKKNKR